ncbi:MAG: hypothetical protein ETSY1_39180, partial [Candidatus Entotheonella factor]
MQASDNSLGPYLRSEREQQGIDLHDIASMTKIQPKFIEALEADDYDRLPKGPFVIGFLRSYAQCLSLDADEIVAFFQAHHRQQKPMSSPPMQEPERSAPLRSFPMPRVSWQHGAILSVGLVALIGIFFWVLRSGPSTPNITPDRRADTLAASQPAARPVISAAAVSPSPAPPSPAFSAPASPEPSSPSLANLGSSPETAPTPADSPQTDAAPSEAPAPAVSEEPAQAPAPLVLRVQALEETWMRLDIDDGDRQEALIQAGQSREWKANSQFSLTIGNVKGARVLLNDQELDLPAPRSNSSCQLL